MKAIVLSTAVLLMVSTLFVGQTQISSDSMKKLALSFVFALMWCVPIVDPSDMVRAQGDQDVGYDNRP